MAVKHLAAAVSALLLAAGAQASSSITASLSDFGVAVTQGSASWSPTFEDNALFVRLYVNSSDVVTTPTNDVMTFGSPFSTMSLASSGTVSSALASATAKSLSISLSTPAAGGSAYAFASWETHFNMAAHSSVTFTWLTSNAGSVSGGATAYSDVALGAAADQAQAIGKSYLPVSNTSYKIDGVNYSYWTANGRQFASVSTGADALSNIGFFARVQGHTVDVATAAVPEPESLALAVSGLAVAGVLARRRRQAA